MEFDQILVLFFVFLQFVRYFIVGKGAPVNQASDQSVLISLILGDWPILT